MIIENTVGLCVCSSNTRLKIVCSGKQGSDIFGGFTLYGGGLGVVSYGLTMKMFVRGKDRGGSTYVHAETLGIRSIRSAGCRLGSRCSTNIDVD